MKNIFLAGTKIHDNTLDLGFVINIPIKGLDFPEVRLSKYDKPGEHGAIVQTQFYGGRNIILTGRVSGNTIAQYMANKRTLIGLMSTVLDSLNNAQPLLLQFKTMDDISLQCNCFAAGPPNMIDKSLNHGAFILTFYAPDPNLYDQALQVITISMPSGGGAVYPVIYPVIYSAKTGGTITITNGGTANSFSYPVLTFTGPLTSPYVLNLTTNQFFLLNLTLSTGDVLVADMANKTVVLNGTTNALQYISSTSSWLSLAAGDNIVKLDTSLSANTGNVQVTFRNSYLGI